MNEPDRLAEITQHRHLMYGPNTDPHHFVNIRLSDLDWLTGEVERYRDALEQIAADGVVGYESPQKRIALNALSR